MSSAYTVLNPGFGGSVMDETTIPYSGTVYEDRRRARIILAGDTQEKIVQVKNDTATGSEYAIVTREIPTWQQSLTYEYGDANIAKGNPETSVVSYAVPSGYAYFFTGLNGSASAVGIFRGYLDGNQFCQMRNNITNLNVNMNSTIPLVRANPNSVVEIKAENLSVLSSESFEATMYGFTTPLS
jgi:hypothetical protein